MASSNSAAQPAMTSHLVVPIAMTTTPQPSSRRSSSGMTQQQLQQQQGSTSAVRFKYEDFISAAGQNFQDLVDQANDWLTNKKPSTYAGVQVRTCETVTWMSATDDMRMTAADYSDQTLLSKSVLDRSKTYYTRGLRLWLVGRTTSTTAAMPKTSTNRKQLLQKLRYFDVLPADVNDTIVDLVSRANKIIERRHVTGRILTVETVGVPVTAASSSKSLSNLTRWTEDTGVDTPYLFVLRVFYDSKDTLLSDSELGSGPGRYGTRRLTIGIQDIVPSTDGCGNYEGFDSLINKANVWLKEQREASVINFQSVLIQKTKGNDMCTSGQQSGGGGGVPCRYVMPGINNTNHIELLRILRIVFFQRTSPASRNAKPAAAAAATVAGKTDFRHSGWRPLTVASRSVIPEVSRSVERCRVSLDNDGELVTRWVTEPMKMMFNKASGFLHQSPDYELISAETVVNPLQIYVNDDVDCDDRMLFVCTLRLFLATSLTSNGQYSSTSIYRSSSLNHQSDSSAMNRHSLGGDRTSGTDGNVREPLFLSHVVSGQFPYRWLVLAISAFTCMTIIVILSIVYSNR